MKRRLVKLVALLVLPRSVASIYRAFERFKDPFPTWMTEAPRWYDEAIHGGIGLIVASALITYDVRRTRAEKYDAAYAPSDVPAQQRWRDMPELRFALYCVAVAQVLEFPLGILKAIQALNNDPPSFSNTFWSLFPVGGIIYPLMGIGLIIYDRRRLKRELHLKTGYCAVCGYDLRATPNRCPECGTIVPAKEPASVK